MKAFLKEVKEKYGTITDIYIPANRFTEYFQSAGLNPAELADAAGLSGQYAEALGTGGDMIIPLEEYVTKFAGGEHHSALTGMARLSPDGFSTEEAANFTEEQQRLLEEEVTKADEAAAVKTSENKVFDDVYQQLRGIDTPDTQARAGGCIIRGVLLYHGQAQRFRRICAV